MVRPIAEVPTSPGPETKPKPSFREQRELALAPSGFREEKSLFPPTASSLLFVALSVDSPQFQRFRDPVNCHHIRGNAVIDLMRLRVLNHDIEGIHHNVHQAFVDFAFAPEEPLPVLHPFEVAHGHAAGVAQDVRNSKYAFTVQNGCRTGKGSSGAKAK